MLSEKLYDEEAVCPKCMKKKNSSPKMMYLFIYFI